VEYTAFIFRTLNYLFNNIFYVKMGLCSVVGCDIGGDFESSGTASREWLIIKKDLKQVGFEHGR
jgi:hypothetical protein